MYRTIPPVPGNPGEFADVFARRGWEGVESVFGGRTDLHRKWIAMTGAQCRMPKRAKVRSNAECAA